MNSSLQTKSTDIQSPAGATFDRLKAAYRRQPYITLEERTDTLMKIEQILTRNEQAICDAICTDFGNRSFHESRILEIATSILGLRDARKHLKKWMKTQKRHVSMIFMGGKNRVIPQAKGVIGIIAPWNYPLFLVMSPLTSAIAAGNRVMIKMAGNSQNLCSLLQKKFSEMISEDIITFMPGVGASEFSTLPFNHLIFTGSPGVGKTIMQSAAKHLTPVTLELGGKSPTILLDDFDVKVAANRIMAAKLMNGGQTCVAPDYLFVPENKLKAFIDQAKSFTANLYSDILTKDYTAIIDSRAYARLMDTIADAREKGAHVIQLISGDAGDENTRKISPVILTDVSSDMEVMQNEIFGPVLPIMTYRKIDEVIDYINDHERPLALYLFTHKAQDQDHIVTHTLSGGVTVNDCAMHVAQHDIPFGGIGNSGMGQYHGYEGFMEFSKLRPVFKQSKWPVAVTPPYGKTFDWIYNSILKFKWLK
ncbi:MAG: coniferyl aldehyde dehydrogenase [Proteobacteria bacterium]|nr:coniferyl aldehyde dehydrogenase [Pseudomonadota bacterium]MBU1387969.1 coniferyl aldehyde dehydrogenase [Pseudomonadota bacterium]MBU1542032.1 coniferyl aldehyde dehydrogenase [Pseudomonadota bacterium]MBU2483061.1 coniferyl aldehyde dehydrogenase [Pseudomonadota bacterium]